MPTTRWQNKIRGVRRLLRGWARNQAGENTKKKTMATTTVRLFG